MLATQPRPIQPVTPDVEDEAPRAGRKRSAATLLQVVVAGLLLAWAVSSLSYPFGIDNGIHAWAGRVVARGGVPYLDAWDNRGPLAIVVNALVQLVFGENTWGIRVFDLLMLGAAGYALRRALTDAGRPRGADTWLAAGLLALWVASAPPGSLAQPDLWCGLAMTLGFAPLCRAGAARDRQYLAAGIAVGLCALNKPFYLAFGAVPAIHALWPSGTPLAARVRGVALAALGTCLPVALCVGWLALRGAAGEMWSAYIRFNLEVYTQQGRAGLVTRALDGLRYLLHDGPMATAVPVAAVGAVALWRERRGAAAAAVVWALGTIAVVILQGRNWVHHWMPALAPLALLAACGVRGIGAWLTRAAPRALVTGALAVALLGAASLDVATRLMPWVGYVLGRTSRDDYLVAHTAPANSRYNSAPAEEAAAAYLRAHTPANATILTWGYDATLSYLSGHLAPTRYAYNGVFFLGTPSWRDRFRRELLRDVAARPPYYVVIARSEPVPVAAPTFAGAFRDFDALRQLVASDYEFERQIERYAIFRRRSAAPVAPAAPGGPTAPATP